MSAARKVAELQGQMNNNTRKLQDTIFGHTKFEGQV